MPKLTKNRNRGERDWYQLQHWRNIAKAQLRHEPLCAICFRKGLIRGATIADHIEPHRGDWNTFLLGKLQSLCKQCHDSDKQRIDRGFKPKLFYGLNGWPIDTALEIGARRR